MRSVSTVVAFFCFVGVAPLGAETAEVICEGKVVGQQGEPIAGAKVAVYKTIWCEWAAIGFKQPLLTKTETDAQGDFTVRIPLAADQAVMVASGKDVSMGWYNWNRKWRADDKILISLTKPMRLAGTVLNDEGAPVAGAEVRALLMIAEDGVLRTLQGFDPLESLVTRSDSEGHFLFDGIPADARADFIVSAPGRARLYTRTVEQEMAARWPAGATDIRIVLPVEAKVVGKVIEKETGKPVGNVRLTIMPARPHSIGLGWRECISDEEGRFRMGALAADTFLARLVRQARSLADWVALPVSFSTEAGQTTDDVTIEVTKGGIVEVAVRDAATNEPVEEAYVIADNRKALYVWPIGEKGKALHGHNGFTDAQGLARVRVIPGTIRINANARGYDFNYSEPLARQNVAYGETVRVEVKLHKKGQQ